MITTYLNTVTREWFDENGNQFSAKMPEMAYQGRETVKVYLKKETPNAGELGVNPAEWPADNQLTAIPGIGAMLTVDSDFTHKLKGAFVSNTANTISAKFSNIKPELIPTAGIVRVFNNAGNVEKLRYQSRTIDNKSNVDFILADGLTVAGSYTAGDVVDCDQAPYASVYFNPEDSNISKGIFSFDLVMDSARLRSEMDYANVSSLKVQGLELLFYSLDTDGNQEPIKAYLLDTFTVTGTMGSLENDAIIPDPLKNEIAAYVGSLIEDYENAILNRSWGSN